MSNFWQRAITGFFFVLVICLLTGYHAYSFLGLLLLIAAGGLIEFYSIVNKRKANANDYLITVLSVITLAIHSLFHPFLFVHTLAILFAIASFLVLFKKEASWKEIAYYGVGILYIVIPLDLFFGSACMGNTGASYNFKTALNFFVLIWCSDTFAYVSGKLFGKHKLLERISPGKTIEGLVGSLILTAASSVLLAQVFSIPVHVNIILALLTVVFGTLGDLVESKLKREFNIKDSGNILPGHGGVLDRFDALFLSLPFTTAAYMHLM